MPTPKPVSEETIRPEVTGTVAWDDAAKRLAEAGTFWMAIVRGDDQPHVRPILAVWVDGTLHVVSSTSARTWSNLAQGPRCSIAAETPGPDLVVEGEAVRVTDDSALRRVADAYDSKYEWPVEIRDGAFFAEGAPTAGPPPFHVFEIQPANVFGFGTDERHFDRSTRWRFQTPPQRENET